MDVSKSKIGPERGKTPGLKAQKPSHHLGICEKDGDRQRGWWGSCTDPLPSFLAARLGDDF